MNTTVLGLILIAFGVLYQFRPDIFRRWFWKRTSLAQRMLSPAGYVRYMRGLGILYILAGVGLCLFSALPGRP